MPAQVRDINEVTQSVALETEVSLLREEILNWNNSAVAKKIDEWISKHNNAEPAPVDKTIRTRVIYKDTTADNTEKTVYVPGTIVEATTVSESETHIRYSEDKTGIVKEFIDSFTGFNYLTGPIISTSLETADTGSDNYELLQNLPYITYEKDSQVHKAYLRGNVSDVIKKLIPATPVITYKDRAGETIEKHVEGSFNIEDIGVGKIRYANRNGQPVEKDIHDASDILDLTDIGIGRKVSIITYNGNDNEQHQERLNGAVTEYKYDETTHKTTLKYIDDETNEEKSALYDGDVIEVVFGFDTLPGGSDYRLFEHIPTITYTDPDTNEEVTAALRGGTDDDITELLKHAFTPRLYYVDADGNKQDLAGDMTDKLAQPFTAQDVDDIWNEV